MRQRIEDLGRLSILLRVLLDHTLFEKDLLPSRPKDYPTWFSDMQEDEKDELIRNWVYGIEDIKDQLHFMLEIADGGDVYNNFEHEQN